MQQDALLALQNTNQEAEQTAFKSNLLSKKNGHSAVLANLEYFKDVLKI